MVRYEEFIDENLFQTGDLLLFSSKDNCTSCSNCLFSYFRDTIKYCTNSKYTHSAIIIERKHAIMLNPILSKENYYVLQSSYELFPDAENNELKFGVEIVSLEQLFNTYDGKIFWRHIDCPRNNLFIDRLIDAHSVVHNRAYDINLYDWIRAAFNIEVGPTHRLNEFWCSALVAYIYTKLEFFQYNTNWTLISPKMLSDQSTYPKFRNCTIYDEVRVL